MKKIILTLAAIVGVAGYTYGQGQVIFNSSSSAQTQISTNNGTIGKIVGPVGTWQFGLFLANNSTVTTVGGVASTRSRSDVTPWTDPNWTFTGIYATNIASAGRMVGVTDPGGWVVVPGTVAGNNYNFIIVGWNTAVGGTDLNSLRTAYTAGAAGLLYGTSAICLQLLMGNNGNPANTTLTGINTYQTPGWSLSAPPAVPEPATFALAGLGAAAMLIFRRRK